MRIGILGVGHLATFLVDGLRRAGDEQPIVLSPRNRGRAQALARRCACTVATDNADLVERSELVVLATRPPQAVDAVTDLPWTADHVLVSVAAGVGLASLRAAAAPATVVRAMPVSCAAIGHSPTALFPDERRARALLEQVGTVHVLPDEAAFEVASVLGAFYAWAFALAAEGTRWTREHAVDPDTARALVVGMLRGAAGMMAAQPDVPPAEMLDALATPGGLTRLGLGVMDERGALAAWSEACDAVLSRVRETSS